MHSHLGLPHLLFVDRTVHVCEVAEPLTSLKIDLRSLPSSSPPHCLPIHSSGSGSGIAVGDRIYRRLLESPLTSSGLLTRTTAASRSPVNLIKRLHGYLWKLIKQRGASSLVCHRLSGSVQLIQLHLFRDIVHPPHPFESVYKHLCTTDYCTLHNIQHLPPFDSVALDVLAANFDPLRHL